MLCYAYCPDATYVVEIYKLCEPCHYTCATCTDDTAACDSCGTNRNLVLNACPCMDYYY